MPSLWYYIDVNSNTSLSDQICLDLHADDIRRAVIAPSASSQEVYEDHTLWSRSWVLSKGAKDVKNVGKGPFLQGL